jgi:two-component system, OmpR family, response regulator AdeR
MVQPVKSIKVLIAEDDVGICEMYSTAFMKEGFKVYTAKDGKNALEKYYSKQPDIILLDIMMPELDGYQVLKEIRTRHDKYIPVVMLTNLDMEHFTAHDSVDNVDAYLIKSNYTPSEIVTKAMEVLKANNIV